MDVDIPRGEGFRSYYITKIEELQLIVAEKSQNLRRLQAQRNELNAKGKMFEAPTKFRLVMTFSFKLQFVCSERNCNYFKNKVVMSVKL